MVERTPKSESTQPRSTSRWDTLYIADLYSTPERHCVVVVIVAAVAAEDLHLAAGHALREAAVEDVDEGGQEVGAVVEVAGRQEVPEQWQRGGARHDVGWLLALCQLIEGETSRFLRK